MKWTGAGPSVMKDEIRAAIRKTKLKKARNTDSMLVELLETLEDYEIDKTTTLLKEIYDTGQIPRDISKSISIALTNKPGAIE